MLQGYNGKGQNQMKNPVRDIRCFSSGISTAAWQNPKGNGKKSGSVQEKSRIPGCSWRWCPACIRFYNHLLFIPCTEDSQQKRTRKNDQKTDSAKQKGICHSLADYFYYVLLVFKRNAKVSMNCIFQPFYILDIDWFIQPQFFHGPFPFRWTHFFSPVSIVGNKRISRRKPRYIENHHRQKENTAQKKEQFFSIIKIAVTLSHLSFPL